METSAVKSAMKPFVLSMKKSVQYYKGICIMADTGLHDQIAEIIAATIPQGAFILDFGSGQGAMSQRLHDMGYRVLSVDIDRENFKAETEFLQLDFNEPSQLENFLHHHAGAFDMVLGIEVIEHVENPWQYVRNLKALTRPGGFILISTPNITSWYSRLNFLRRGRFHQFEDIDRSYGHINPVSADELTFILSSLDLAVVKLVPGGWLPRLWYPGSLRGLLLNLFGFLASFRMRGIWQGWALICLAQRK